MTIALPPLRSTAAERTGDPVGSQLSFHQCIRPEPAKRTCLGTFPSKDRTHLWEIGRKSGLPIQRQVQSGGSPRGSGRVCSPSLPGSAGLQWLQPSLPQAQHPVAARGKLKIVRYQDAGQGFSAVALQA